MRGHPRRRNAEQHSGDHRNSQREQQHRRRGAASTGTKLLRARRPGRQDAGSAWPRHTPRPTPAAPPIYAGVTLSTSALRTSRRRDAPSATRTAVCCRFFSPRASSRLAILAHATSSTQHGGDQQQPQTVLVVLAHAAKRPRRPASDAASAFARSAFSCGVHVRQMARQPLVQLDPAAAPPAFSDSCPDARVRSFEPVRTAGFFSRAVAPVDQRLGRQRQPEVGHAPAGDLCAEETRRGHADIVNGWPLIWYVDPPPTDRRRTSPARCGKLITATGGAPS